jgi:hypothetical protein
VGLSPKGLPTKTLTVAKEHSDAKGRGAGKQLRGKERRKRSSPVCGRGDPPRGHHEEASLYFAVQQPDGGQRFLAYVFFFCDSDTGTTTTTTGDSTARRPGSEREKRGDAVVGRIADDAVGSLRASRHRERARRRHRHALSIVAVVAE